MLKFIGRGSAFNTKEGNNSAYYKKGNEMLLIDCGSNIFERIKENNLLEGIDKVHVIITHTHADHVGSLADLILYTYYSHGEFAKTKVEVYSMWDVNVDELLKLNGCVQGTHYTDKKLSDYTDYFIETMDLIFYFFEQEHVEELKCYGVEINVDEKYFSYSSDSNSIDDLADFINLHDDEMDVDCIYYIDTCAADYEGNVHLSLRELTKKIVPEKRHKVWCMHLDEKFDVEYAKSLGFNVVEVDLG